MAYRFTWIIPDLLAAMACPGYFTELGGLRPGDRVTPRPGWDAL